MSRARHLFLSALLLAAAALCGASPACAAGATQAGVTWETDYARAAARAKAEGKDLFLNFTGSDWCGYCLKLEKEVFTQPAFAAQAERSFVFVYLDRPQDPARAAKVVDPALRDRLTKRYEITALPALMLTTATGVPFGKLGYEPIKATGYAQRLGALRRNRGAILRLMQVGIRSTPAELRVGIPALDEAGLLEMTALAKMRSHARRTDPQGALGVRARVDAAEARARFRAYAKQFHKMGRTQDWHSVHRTLCGYRESDLRKDRGLQEQYINMTYEATLEMIEAGKWTEAREGCRRLAASPLVRANKSIAAKVAEMKRDVEARSR